MNSRAWYRQLSWTIVFAWAGLVVIGLIAIYSSTHGPAAEYLPEQMTRNFQKQVIFGSVGVLGAVVILNLRMRFFQAIAYPAYLLTLVLLLVTAVIGREINGAKGWLPLPGGFSIQTAEFAKVATLLAVAALLSNRRPGSNNLRYGIAATVLLLIPAAIVIGPQNDTGTGLVFLGLIPIMLFWSELPLNVLALMMAPALAGYFAIVSLPVALAVSLVLSAGMWIATKDRLLTGLAVAFTFGVVAVAGVAVSQLQPHQRARIEAFTNPEAEEFRSGVGYHQVQSKAAIGSGGLTGKGFMHGSQTQGAYIPEQSTDFVFTIIGEEFGFLGGMTLLVLYGLLLTRLVRLGVQMRHPFGSMLAAGTAGIFLIHLFVNIGMVTGLLPVIGIPLPFVSYGGAALMANTLMLAISLSLHLHRDDVTGSLGY